MNFSPPALSKGEAGDFITRIGTNKAADKMFFLLAATQVRSFNAKIILTCFEFF